MPTIDLSELRDLVDKLQDKSKLQRAVKNSLFNVVQAQATFTVKNTRFKNPTGVTLGALDTSVSGLSGSIFVDKAKVPYIEPLYFGSKPHVIEPKNKKALSWGAGGGRVFAKKVNHPGYKGNPFILKAYEKNKNKIFKQYSDDLTEQIQDIL